MNSLNLCALNLRGTLLLTVLPLHSVHSPFYCSHLHLQQIFSLRIPSTLSPEKLTARENVSLTKILSHLWKEACKEVAGHGRLWLHRTMHLYVTWCVLIEWLEECHINSSIIRRRYFCALTIWTFLQIAPNAFCPCKSKIYYLLSAMPYYLRNLIILIE